MKLSLAKCAEWMNGELLGGEAEAVAQGYSIDSRTVAAGELFFAVSGDRFDAHSFVASALKRGACGAVISKREAAVPGAACILVDEPLAALQRLGAAVRREWLGTLVGLTGSAGKTTTKEMVATVLGARYSVLKSAGNLNNHFGVPLQLLRLEPEHEYAVIEMGMSAAGEIALLAQLAAPDWGVVTNVGQAHTQNFADGIAGVAHAKRELVEALPATGIAFLNADDARVRRFATAFAGRSVLVGRADDAAVRATTVSEHGTEGLAVRVRAGVFEADLHLQLLGAHNATNALLALAVGLAAGVPLQEGCAALAALAPGDKRGEVLHLRGAQVINDCYNSNPTALAAMIGTLAQIAAKRRFLIAGEMLELGPESAALHAQCGAEAARAGIDSIAGVRGDAQALVAAAQKAGADARFFQTPQEAGAWLREELREGDAVLLKGSRGVQLEGVLAELGADTGA